MRYCVSVKGVLQSPAGEIVLLMNEREEWELPGGQIEIGESSEECLAREIDEELGLRVRVGELLDTYLFEVIEDAHVFIATYRCELDGEFEPKLSHEHKRLACFRPTALPQNLPAGYRRSIEAVLATSVTQASDAVRLGKIAEPAKMRDSGQGVGDGTWFGFQPGGDPFVLLHWRMEPGSVIRRHAHSYGHVVTLVLGGELLVENHEMLGERNFEHEGTFNVRRTQRQILRAGNVNLVNLEHDYVHGFYAGDKQSHGFNITMKIRERRPTPYLDLAEKPLGADRDIYEGSWSIDQRLDPNEL